MPADGGRFLPRGQLCFARYIETYVERAELEKRNHRESRDEINNWIDWLETWPLLVVFFFEEKGGISRKKAAPDHVPTERVFKLAEGAVATHVVSRKSSIDENSWIHVTRWIRKRWLREP